MRQELRHRKASWHVNLPGARTVGVTSTEGCGSSSHLTLASLSPTFTSSMCSEVDERGWREVVKHVNYNDGGRMPCTMEEEGEER